LLSTLFEPNFSDSRAFANARIFFDAAGILYLKKKKRKRHGLLLFTENRYGDLETFDIYLKCPTREDLSDN
jgi:hypothetical protein